MHAAATLQSTGAALALALGAAKLVRWWLLSRLLGGLDNVVGYSARVIAAARALENERDKPLVCDALAADLAGARALKQARMRAASLSMASPQGQEAPSMPGDAVPKPRVTRLVMRTLYFDDALRVALGQHHRAQAAALRSLAQEAGHGVGCSQVVLLGAGMDTRAWRLPLASSAGPSDDGVSTDPRRANGTRPQPVRTWPSPSAGAHVAWFEVDQADVLAVKQRVLRRLGASFVPTPVGQNSAPRGLRALATRAARRSIRHPLQSARYSAVAADLQVPGWSRALVAAGFNPSAATVWVLEGLLYYLQPHSVPGMIQECARVSGPGSVLVASSVSQEMVDSLAKRPGPRRADDIMAEFKWGLPGLPDQWPAFFLDLGWRVLGLPQWTHLAEEYGLQPWLPQPPAAQAAAPDANLLGATQQQGPPAEVEAEVQAKGVRQEVATTNTVPRLVYATCVLDNTQLTSAAAAHAP
ncbi:S-adenosyl-L-methionine-dependent methyltransferase [Haematococcus lacustris]